MTEILEPPVKICRLCLSNTATFTSILENKVVSDMLLSLTSLVITLEDVISTVMCVKCRLNLNLAYTIQQNMIKAEERFHQRQVLKQDAGGEAAAAKETFFNGFACEICSKECPSQVELNRHRYNHKRKKCPICDKSVTASNLHTHVEGHEYGPQVCELCGATLKTKSNLRQHVFYSHNESRHKCNFCDKVFKRKSYREAHQKKEHLEEPTQYVCDTCGKKFFAITNLNAHIKMTHLKLRPYVCDFCNTKFSSSFALKTHRRQHTNETPYKCDFCGEGFRQNVSLKTHLKRKHNVVGKITCRCQICGKGFSSKVALGTHKRLQICTPLL